MRDKTSPGDRESEETRFNFIGGSARRSLFPAGDSADRNSLNCGEEDLGEGDSEGPVGVGGGPVIRPSGTFSPTVKSPVAFDGRS